MTNDPRGDLERRDSARDATCPPFCPHDYVDDGACVACGRLAADITPATLVESKPTGPKLAPYFDKILVQRDEGKSEYSPGIGASDHFKDRLKRLTGTVLAVGQGRLRPDGSLAPLHTEVGDRVTFGEFTGMKLPDDLGERMYMLREDELLAKVIG